MLRSFWRTSSALASVGNSITMRSAMRGNSFRRDKLRAGDYRGRGKASPRFMVRSITFYLRIYIALYRKRLDAGQRSAEDERMHVVGAFIGIDRLKVLGMTHHMILT